MASFTERLVQPTTTSMIAISGTSLNGLSNGGAVSGSSMQNLATKTMDGAPAGYLVMNYKLQGTASAGGSLSVWILGAQDPGADASYEDGSNSAIPARMPDAIIPCFADNNAHQVEMPVLLKVGYQRVLLQNNSGQAFTASNTDNVLRLSVEERQSS